MQSSILRTALALAATEMATWTPPSSGERRRMGDVGFKEQCDEEDAVAEALRAERIRRKRENYNKRNKNDAPLPAHGFTG